MRRFDFDFHVSDQPRLEGLGTELAFVIWALGWTGLDWTWDLDEHLFGSGMASTLGSWVGHVFRHLGQDYTYPLPYILVNNVLLMVPVQTGPWRAFPSRDTSSIALWLHPMRPLVVEHDDHSET
jgi:hypothetical protein